MDEPKAWETSRSIVLFGVLAVHVALLAVLWMSSRARNRGASIEPSVEVMFLAPPKAPRVRVENIRQQRVSTHIAIGLAPPEFNSSMQSGPSSAPDGHGSAVNWVAEAHRAVRAFEIRRDHPPSSAMSVSPLRDEWWPREHHAGDRFKTASGDWIVWVNADCYQVASWHSNATVSNATPPQTICSAQSTPPRDD
jgi:hypothetical protein